MIYRQRIPQWTEFGAYHDVLFYTKKVVHESVARYRIMEKVPFSIEECFEDCNVTAVIQDRNTGEILKVYTAPEDQL